MNRLQKTLEGANIKLGSVATDILGKSGREMLAALVAGATDRRCWLQLARASCGRRSRNWSGRLVGRFGAHQRFLVARQLAHIDYLDELIAQLSAGDCGAGEPF